MQNLGSSNVTAMPFPPPTFAIVVLATAFFATAIGIFVFLTNTGRLSNQIYFATSILLSIWLFCVYKVVVTPHIAAFSDISVRWMKANAAVAALFPWCTWLIKESVITSAGKWIQILRRSALFLSLSCIQIFAVYLTSFVSISNTPNGNVTRGLSYIVYHLLTIISITVILLQALRDLKHQVGIKKIELQFLTLTTTVSALVIFSLNFAGGVLHIPSLNRSTLLVVIIGHGLTAWGVALHEIFDARQILLSVLHRITILSIMGSAVCLVLFNFFPPGQSSITIIGSLMLLGWIVMSLNELSAKLLDLNGEKALSKARTEIIRLLIEKPDPVCSIKELEHKLAEQFNAKFAVVLIPSERAYTGHAMNLTYGCSALRALFRGSWATEGQIEQRLKEDGAADLATFIVNHKIGLLLSAPPGNNPSLIIAFGEKKDGWVFTRPEIRRIQNICELVDNIITHSRLTSQAALRSKMEHLAIMSRGLAHDLKNLLTPITSFIVYSESYIPNDKTALEVHRAARRSSKLMTDYVREVMSFGEHLQPKLESISLRYLARVSAEDCAERAAGRRVRITIGHVVDDQIMGDRVLLRRMLTNIVSNAIDASPSSEVITISAIPQSDGNVCCVVRDFGCGISKENLPRIFDPYFTTKIIGDESRGFGLGLTVAQKVAHLHNGSIIVRSELGYGTSMTITLPKTQPPERIVTGRDWASMFPEAPLYQ